MAYWKVEDPDEDHGLCGWTTSNIGLEENTMEGLRENLRIEEPTNNK